MSIQAVVLGGGLGGVACAKELARPGGRVTLVDRNDYHQCQPLLYQVATSQLPAADIARPLRRVFTDDGGVDFVQAEVVAASCAERSLTLADGRQVRGDVVALAAGGGPDHHGVSGAAEHAIPLYSVADAEQLRRHMRGVLQRLEDGDGTATGDVVVVGAGMIGRNAAVAEMGRHRHEIDGPLAFGAWLDVHAMLLSGVHSRTDAFLNWARDYIDRDDAAMVENWSAPGRMVFDNEDDDGSHIAGEQAAGDIADGSS